MFIVISQNNVTEGLCAEDYELEFVEKRSILHVLQHLI